MGIVYLFIYLVVHSVSSATDGSLFLLLHGCVNTNRENHTRKLRQDNMVLCSPVASLGQQEMLQ